MKVGDFFKKIRKEKGFSQERVAKSAGIVQSYYSYIENSKAKQIPFETIEAICEKGLEIPVDDFLANDDVREDASARIVMPIGFKNELKNLDFEYMSLFKEFQDKKISPKVIKKLMDIASELSEKNQ